MFGLAQAVVLQDTPELEQTQLDVGAPTVTRQLDGSAAVTAWLILVAEVPVHGAVQPYFIAYWPPARSACWSWICCCAALPSSTSAKIAGTSTKATNVSSIADMPRRSESSLRQAPN